MGWVLRLAETGPDAAAESIDLIEIHRSSGLGDIANLGLTLSEAKELLARVQQAIVVAQAPRQLHARGSAYLFCVILPDAALLAIIAFAEEHPIAVLAITSEADAIS
jgi:hypothetical protein